MANDQWSVASRTMEIALTTLVLFGAFSIHTSAATTDRFDEFSRKCGLSVKSKQRIFSAADGEDWKEYPSRDKVPEGNGDWSEGAFVRRNAQVVTAEIDGAGQDFSDSSLYCFDVGGNLIRIEREFRTAWGWGYSEADSFEKGVVSSHQEHYFDTKTQGQIPRPAGYDDVHDAMKLKVYKTVKQLPFYTLM